MGGCYQTGASQQVAARQTVDGGEATFLLHSFVAVALTTLWILQGIINVAFETSQPEPRESRQYALMRVLKHKVTQDTNQYEPPRRPT